MVRLRSTFLIILLAGFSLLPGCDDDNPVPVNPEELITTLKITFTESGSSNTVVWQFQDLDGELGGMPPTITAPALPAGTTYNASIELLNEAESPAINITQEVKDEAEEHQFFFTGTATNQLLAISYADMDVDGNPLGLEIMVTTDAAGGTGELTVILRHEPDKNAAGVASGDIANAGGETDIEVTFNAVVN